MCTVTAPARRAIPGDASAARSARAFLREVACRAHPPAAEDEAQLLISELVTNAVRHGRPPITTEIECQAGAGLRVRVCDASTDLPERQDAGPEDEGGRGIALVDLMSTEWGVERCERGKAIWFRVA